MGLGFGRKVSRCTALVSVAIGLAAGAASAMGSDPLSGRLDSLLGSGRDAAELGAGGGLPGAAERGLEVEIDLAAVVAEADAAGDEEWRCLSEAIYHEARGESLEGQVAVAEVILNRRDGGRYPETVCGVVRQGTGEKWRCQFSYYCDGLSDAINEEEAWDLAGRIARVMLDGAPRELTDGAEFYHTKAVDPYWAEEFVQTAEIGAHLFYVEDAARMASSASD